MEVLGCGIVAQELLVNAGRIRKDKDSKTKRLYLCIGRLKNVLSHLSVLLIGFIVGAYIS